MASISQRCAQSSRPDQSQRTSRIADPPVWLHGIRPEVSASVSNPNFSTTRAVHGNLLRNSHDHDADMVRS
jgi:hypothetical protein